MFPANYTFLQKLFDTLNWNGTFVLVFRYDHGEGNGGGSFSVKKHGVVCRKWTQLLFNFFFLDWTTKKFCRKPRKESKKKQNALLRNFQIFKILCLDKRRIITFTK